MSKPQNKNIETLLSSWDVTPCSPVIYSPTTHSDTEGGDPWSAMAQSSPDNRAVAHSVAKLL